MGTVLCSGARVRYAQGPADCNGHSGIRAGAFDLKERHMTNAPAKPPALGPRERILGGPTLGSALAEWWEDLVWPRILGSARLGLRPGRVGLALFAVLTAWVLLDVGAAIDSRLVKAGVQFSWDQSNPQEAFLVAPWKLY